MKNSLITYSKIQFDTLNPKQEDIRIEDIAHALSLMARGNGHFPEFFSVAQHSIQCCNEAFARNYVPQAAMACLLHDASEAYLSDIARPVKKNMTMYLQIEEQLQNMIYEKYLGVIPRGEIADLIDNIDDTCLYYEFEHFMDLQIYPAEPVMMSETSYAFRPMKEVEAEFLQMFHRLEQELEKER